MAPVFFHLRILATSSIFCEHRSILRSALAFPSKLNSSRLRILGCQPSTRDHHFSNKPTISFSSHSTSLGFPAIPVRTPDSAGIDPASSNASACAHPRDHPSTATSTCARRCAILTGTTPYCFPSVRPPPTAVPTSAAAAAAAAADSVAE